VSFVNKEKFEHYIASYFGAGAYNYIRTNIENIDKGDRQTKLVRLPRTAKRGDEHPQSLYVANSANCDRTASSVRRKDYFSQCQYLMIGNPRHFSF
jgi:hypothetical protein